MHYAALSYCWGGNQALLLTSDTIEELSFKGISQEDLPRTIADAITVAISLGIQYLWVDALCILQDSEEDKAREIAKVAMVYSNATVTMAVSRASSVDEGFLSDRFPVEHTAVIELIVSEYQPGSTKTAMLVPQEPDATDLVSVMDHNPLGKRAWTFQERLLSPRVLDYGEVQTRWWCPEMMKLKDAPERTVWTDGWVYPEAGDTGQLDAIAQIMEGWIICDAVPLGRVSSGQRQNNSVNEAELCKRWKTIVDHYSGRQLTLSSDRLPKNLGHCSIIPKFVRLSVCRGTLGRDDAFGASLDNQELCYPAQSQLREVLGSNMVLGVRGRSGAAFGRFFTRYMVDRGGSKVPMRRGRLGSRAPSQTVRW